MAQIVAVLTCTLDERTYSIVMDTIDETTISSSNELTEQPLINGDFITDHMFRKPISLDITGVFGMGKRQGIVVNDGNLLLTEIESLFERIKNEGIVCSIVKIKMDESKHDVRFLQRNNLILESITWTEAINTLGFRFGFREVAFAESVTYDVDLDDEFLPNVTELQMKSFSETLLNKEEAIKMVIDFMDKNDMMSDRFKQGLAGRKAEWFIGLGAGVLMGYFLASLCTAPYGLIVFAVVVVVAVLVTLFVKIARINKYKVKPFDKVTDKEVKRWVKLLDEMSNEFEAIGDKINVYQLTDDKPQECVLSINDRYLVFDFTRNNTNNTNNLTIFDGNNSPVGAMSDITSCPTNFADCKVSNCIYKDEANSTYVNLIYIGENTETEKQKLTNYVLTISSIRPDDYLELMSQIIKNYLLK